MRLAIFFLCASCATSAASTVTVAPIPSTQPSVSADAPAQSSSARPTSLPGTSIRFAGGDGTTLERAIVIHGAQGESDGVAAEYAYLELVYGPKDVEQRVTSQALMEKNGRSYDRLDVTLLKAGSSTKVYFDITDYFGKF
jgi:hypothetical protein